MRWEDDSMGKTQLPAATCRSRSPPTSFGMFLAAPDDIGGMVQQPARSTPTSAWGRFPAAATPFAGGNNYMVKKDLPGQDQGQAVAWLNFKNLTVGKGSLTGPAPRPTGCLSASPSRTSGWATPRPRTTPPALPTPPYARRQLQDVHGQPCRGQGRAAEGPGGSYKVLDNVMSGILTNEDAGRRSSPPRRRRSTSPRRPVTAAGP